MRLEQIKKKFDLFGIQTHLILLNPYGLRANRTSPNMVYTNERNGSFATNLVGVVDFLRTIERLPRGKNTGRE
jgi:hypothetical protein